jgi:hypothetical protein
MFHVNRLDPRSILVGASLALATGCQTELASDQSGEASAVVQVKNCANIHAAVIAKAELLTACTGVVISSPPLSTLGLGCAGLSPDACAQEHYDHPELYVRPGGVGSFDLHYLPATLGLKCADGSRPHFYFSPGTDDTKWMLYHNGSSGKCALQKDRAGTYYSAGKACYDHFAGGEGNTGFHRREHWEGEGIMNGGPRNVDFRDWNRVWIPSCSNDQYQGSVDHVSETVLQEGMRTWRAPLYSRGHDIVKAVMGELAGGTTVRDLTNAKLVMLYGSSGGAGGVQMVLDAEKAKVASLTSARVVGLLDSRAEPNIAGAEGLFDGAGCGSIFAADCPGNFDVPPVGNDIGAPFPFDTSAYLPDTACAGCGTARLKADWWGANLDASCLAFHAGNPMPCYDGYHVVYEHTSTPVFHATSLRDHNQYNNPIEHVTVAGGEISFQSLEVANCGALPRERVARQLDAYATFRDGAGGAHGASKGAGPIGIWAIDWVDHEVTKEAGIFNDAELDGFTLSETILEWAMNLTPFVLIEGPGHATRTANPTSMQRVNTCP